MSCAGTVLSQPPIRITEPNAIKGHQEDAIGVCPQVA